MLGVEEAMFPSAMDTQNLVYLASRKPPFLAAVISPTQVVAAHSMSPAVPSKDTSLVCLVLFHPDASKNIWKPQHPWVVK